MHALLLAFPAWIRQPEPVTRVENTAAVDLFVLATLSCLFFLLGCFATCAWILWRRSQRPQPHVKLLMELDDGQTQEPARPAAETGASWERPVDWWKQQV